MATLLSPDSPTATTCPACDGQGTSSSELPTDTLRHEFCSWCEGCGFVMLDRLHEWHVHEQQRADKAR